MWYGETQKVKLKVDLTEYDSRCKKGEIGKIIQGGKFSMWDSEDRFGAVEFDNGARLSILLDSLEFIDKK